MHYMYLKSYVLQMEWTLGLAPPQTNNRVLNRGGGDQIQLL